MWLLIFCNFKFNFLSPEVVFNHKSRHQAISKAQVDNNDMSESVSNVDQNFLLLILSLLKPDRHHFLDNL